MNHRRVPPGQFKFAVSYDDPMVSDKPENPLTQDQIVEAAKHFEHIEIADHALSKMLSAVDTHITEQLLDVCKPAFVKKQAIQIALQASLFGENTADLANFDVDYDETDEPVSNC